MRNISCHDFNHLLESKSGAIGAIFCQRAVHVGDGNDARFQRQLLSAQAVRITGAVQFLVMRPSNRRQLAKRSDARKDLARQPRMLLHHAPFLGIQLSRFVENGIRNPELADIMQQGRAVHQSRALFVQSKRLRDTDRRVGHSQ